MALKKYKATSPGVRHAVLVDRSELSKVKPHKPLTKKLNKKAGRNNRGVITMRHKSAGTKSLYRVIDFDREKRNIKGEVETIEYDPNRTAFIALIKYEDGDRKYILAPDGLKIGDTIQAGEEVEIKVGNAMPLSKVPQGMFVNAVEMWPGRGASIARSAGTSVQVMGGDKGYVQLKMPSGEYRLVKEGCYATIGSVSNPDKKNEKLGKAGKNRRKGKRPSVRGVAMSIKHPHAGGQGKKGKGIIGGPAKDKWGNKIGSRTRKHRKPTSKFIIRRRPARNKFKSYKNVI